MIYHISSKVIVKSSVIDTALRSAIGKWKIKFISALNYCLLYIYKYIYIYSYLDMFQLIQNKILTFENYSKYITEINKISIYLNKIKIYIGIKILCHF